MEFFLVVGDTDDVTYVCFQTSMAIPSPASGIIEELFVADGDRVEAGQQLFKLRLSGKLHPVSGRLGSRLTSAGGFRWRC